MSEILAIIPARGGSKRLPHKNIRLLNGKPLLVYSIEQAKASILITRIVVTSDDEETLEIARSLGVPIIKRPLSLAQGEEGSMLMTIQHALGYVEKYWGYKPFIVVILQPTSPLRTAEDIDNTIRLLIDTGADSAETKCGDKENGAVFASRYYVFSWQNKILGSICASYLMPEERSIDIDTEEDFLLAERLLKGERNDNSGMRNQSLRGHKLSPKDDKRGKGKRGRPGKVSTL